jgi:Na+-driven multidrug efflux pump
MLARSSFQALGRAIPGLILTVVRVIGVALPMAYLLVYTFNMGVYGVWLGVIAGNVVAGILAMIWISKSFHAYIECSSVEISSAS